MVDLALKILLDDKARFLTTVIGRRVRRGAGVRPGRAVRRPARQRLGHDRPDGRRPLGRRAEHAQRRLRQPVPRVATSSGSARSPGVARADNLIVWFATVALPGGAKESAVIYALKDFARWNLPWKVLEGDPDDLRRGRYVFLDDSATRRFGPFAVGRPPRVLRPPAQDHRPDRRGPVVHDQPDRLPRLPARPVAHARRAGPAGRPTSSSSSSPGPTPRPSPPRSAGGSRTTTSTPAPSGRSSRATTGSRAPGWA